MIRAFIAIELPDSLRQEVAAALSGLRASGADVKWVEPSNLHLTLKFLGNIEENQIEPLVLSLSKESSIRGMVPFQVQLEGLGAFPRTTNPRVIWVGVNQGEKELTELAQAVEGVCAGLGFAAEERSFSAHLTVGRVRSREGLASLIKKLQVAEFRGSTLAPINRVILFQSTLSPKGPTYTSLAEVSLG